MSIRGKIGAALATGALLMASMAGSTFAATTVTISGNGAFSDNNVNIRQTSRTNIVQTNNANIRNDVSIRSNTGGNTANFNTGGTVFIRTGNITNTVGIHNFANVNRVHGDRFFRDGRVVVLVNDRDRDKIHRVHHHNRVAVFDRNGLCHWVFIR